MTTRLSVLRVLQVLGLHDPQEAIGQRVWFINELLEPPHEFELTRSLYEILDYDFRSNCFVAALICTETF